MHDPAPTKAGLRLSLDRFNFADSVTLSQHLRALPSTFACRQLGAQGLVEKIVDAFRDEQSGEAQVALARCFHTVPYARLPSEERRAALAMLGTTDTDASIAPSLRCLALLGTYGDVPEWRAPAASEAHRVIPLPSVAMIDGAPMIAALFSQMGVDSETLVGNREKSIVLDASRRSFNVFHVEHAAGSPFIPAQEAFVRRHGIRSVIGMGGLMPDGDLFAVILFTKVHVSREVAELFRAVALSVRLLFLQSGASQMFTGQD